MASVNKTVRDTATSMAKQVAMPKQGSATHIFVQKAKGGYISETSYKGTHKGPHYMSPTKAVHKNLASVKSHMSHAFNDADADEA